MPETIRCVHCDAPLRLPEQFIGKEVRCPSCRRAFTARLPATSPAPPSRPEPETEHDEERPSARKPRDADDRPSRRRPRDDGEEDEDYPRSRRPRVRRPGRRYSKGDRSGVILALGIISVVFVLISCIGAVVVYIVPIGIVGLGTGIAAWLMGRKDLEDIRNGERDPSGEGMTNAGFICGIIGALVNGLIVLIQCGIIALVAVVFMAAAAGAN
jgi:hypothetical protein